MCACIYTTIALISLATGFKWISRNYYEVGAIQSLESVGLSAKKQQLRHRLWNLSSQLSVVLCLYIYVCVTMVLICDNGSDDEIFSSSQSLTRSEVCYLHEPFNMPQLNY